MKRLEVSASIQNASIPVLSGRREFFRGFRNIVSKGTDKPFDDVALIPIPGSWEWERSRSEVESNGARKSTHEIYTVGPGPVHLHINDLASRMISKRKQQLFRPEILFADYYLAAPATPIDHRMLDKDMDPDEAVAIDLSKAVCFSGQTLVYAMEQAQVTETLIDYKILGEPGAAFSEYNIGQFLLRLANVEA